ncbi:MAG: hypothetical protein IKL28_01435 [Lachnospiraceae bacterium]|nr:hypothetical protein [Lachnospiraceae bacterium]
MSDTTVKYNTLDLQALLSKKSKIVSSEKALREVEPVSWSDDVMQSQKKVVVKKGTRD